MEFRRQTLIFSEVQHGELNMLFNKFALNAKGRVKIIKNSAEGSVVGVIPQIKQLFQRFLLCVSPSAKI